MSPDPDDLGALAEEFGRVVDVGSSIAEADFEQFDPPPGLWDDIAARLSTADQPNVIAGPGSAGDTTAPDPAAGDRADAPAGPGRDVVDLTARRRSRTRQLLAAAAVVVLAAGTVGVLSTRDAGPSRELVASVELEVLAGPATAQAELVEVDGERRLVIDAEGMPPAPEGQHYELWLIDPEVTDPRSLGPMTGSTEVTIPDSVDPAEYPIVDINLQEDGVEEHSGNSLLRGSLA